MTYLPTEPTSYRCVLVCMALETVSYTSDVPNYSYMLIVLTNTQEHTLTHYAHSYTQNWNAIIS